jgi:hypothetical protein
MTLSEDDVREAMRGFNVLERRKASAALAVNLHRLLSAGERLLGVVKGIEAADNWDVSGTLVLTDARLAVLADSISSASDPPVEPVVSVSLSELWYASAPFRPGKLATNSWHPTTSTALYRRSGDVILLGSKKPEDIAFLVGQLETCGANVGPARTVESSDRPDVIRMRRFVGALAGGYGFGLNDGAPITVEFKTAGVFLKSGPSAVHVPYERLSSMSLDGRMTGRSGGGWGGGGFGVEGALMGLATGMALNKLTSKKHAAYTLLQLVTDDAELLCYFPDISPDSAETALAKVNGRLRQEAAKRQQAETSQGAVDPLDRIAKLAALRDSGALTEKEFQAQKERLLADI